MQSEISRPIKDKATSVSDRPVRNSFSYNLLRFVSWALAVVCFVWAAKDPHFRDGEGVFRGSICFPVSAGIALIILGYSITKPWRLAAGWLAMALIGQSAALQMIDAGQALHYQHYRSIQSLMQHSPWLILILAGQTILALAGWRKHWIGVKSWLSRNFRFWQLAGIAIAFIVTAATVSREVGAYLQELPFAAFVQFINLMTLALAVLSVPNEVLAQWKSYLEKLTGWEADESLSIDRIAIIAAIWVTVFSAILSIFSYQNHPHVSDEVAYLYHARYLATGSLTMPIPPVLEAFDLELFDHDSTRWFCSPPSGWPMILALGVVLKAPWLVNPVLGGLGVLLTYLLIRELYDRRTARLSALLLALSPWYVFLAMSYMTHTASLVCAVGAGLAVVWARKTGRLWYAILSGAVTGLVGMIRPLEGAIIGALIGLWIIGLGGRRLKVPAIAAWIIGCLVVGLAIFYYNNALTGSPAKFPIMVWADKYMGKNSNAMGFGPDRGMGWALDPNPGHGPVDAIINSNLNITAINTELFGWSIGSLLLLAVFFFSMKSRGNDYLMMALMGLVFAAHFFYWFSGGPDFGARYWFLMIIPGVVLSVRGLQILANKMAADVNRRPFQKIRLLAAVLTLCLLGLINFTVWRAIDKYHHYLFMRPDIRSMAEKHNWNNSLILIRGARFPDFASAAIYNPLDLRSGAPIYAWDKNEEVRKQLLKLYSDRQVWIVDGPTLTKAGFMIAEGPMPAQTLLTRDHK